MICPLATFRHGWPMCRLRSAGRDRAMFLAATARPAAPHRSSQYSPQVYGQQVPVYGQQPQAYGQQPQVYGQQPQQLNGQQPQVYGQPQTQPQQVQSGYPGTATAPQQGVGVNIQGGNSGIPQFAQISGQNAQQGANPQSGLPQGNAQQNSAPPIAAAGPVAPGVAQAGSPAPLNSSNMSAATADAQQSALQALGGFAPPQAAAAQSATITPADQGSVLSGNFTANLSNGARVELSLQADGRFNWVAVNNAGQSSNFQGTYRMDNASLSLSRSNDGQTLSGSLTTNGPNSFGFKLADANSSSLNFVRN